MHSNGHRGVSGLALEPVQQFLLFDAVDRSPALVFVADDEMRYLAVNQTACDVLGYSREELLMLKVTDIVVVPEAPSMYQKMLADGSHQGDVEIRHKDGSFQPFAYQAAEVETAGLRCWVSVGFVASQLLEKAQQLESALQSRIAIEQAKGILAERYDIDVDTAFGVLRKGARRHNLRLHDLARRIVVEAETPGEVKAIVHPF